MTHDDAEPSIGLTGARFGGAPRRRRARRTSRADQGSSAAQRVTGRTDAELSDAGLSDAGLSDEDATAPIATVSAADPTPDPVPALVPATATAVAPDADVDAGTEVADDADDIAVGYTGARFGGPSRRKRRKQAAERDATEPDTAAVAPAPGGAVGQPIPEPLPGPAAPRHAPEPVYEADRTVTARPYVLTGGRTRASLELAVESLVSAAPGRWVESSEHAAVLNLCRTPRSVAEIGALLQMPLGVARVLVADLAVQGAVRVHRTVADGGPDLELLDRVLAGLRRL